MAKSAEEVRVRRVIAGEIRETRKEIGLTQGELADRLDMSQQNMSEIEQGNRSIGVDLLERISRALNSRLEINLKPKQTVPVENTDEMAERLQTEPELFHEYGIEKLIVFGSAVRGELTAESDLDMVVISERINDYWTLTELRLKLEVVLGRNVDLATKPMVEHLWEEEIKEQGVELRAA